LRGASPQSGALFFVALLFTADPAAAGIRVTFVPAAPRPGDVSLVVVQGISNAATVEGGVAGRPLAFFPYATGAAALVGIDFETHPGRYTWKIAVVDGGRAPQSLTGRLTVKPRRFGVERLTLPQGMVDLHHETIRRADLEADRLRTVFAAVTSERLWRGRFTAPISAPGDGTGFGVRRILNGRPRSPHGGLDYAAERGTAVVAVNSGRVALVADFFFPGRLVVIDHGLGLHTAYFHLDQISVAQDDLVDRGQTIGLVGSTGRATGPHLHVSAAVGAARIDPAALLGLDARD